MPANLPYEAKAKWLEVTLTKNPETKIQLMLEFLGLVPKHKGTEKLRAQVKSQISGLRDDIERKKKTQTRSGPSYFIQKAGAAQISVIGPPNVGRSSLLKAVTNANVNITAYPFGTLTPQPGMLSYEDIQFQLIEVPPIINGSSQGKADGFQVLSVVRNSDAILLMVDLTNDPIGNLQIMQQELENTRILTIAPQGDVEIHKRGHGRNIQFVYEGELYGCTTDEVIALLNEFKIKSAIIRIKGRVTLETIEDAIFGNSVYRPTIVIANKADLNQDPTLFEKIKEKAAPLQVLLISAGKSNNLKYVLGKKLFNLLEITRVYTKEQGKEPAKEPIISHGITTVGELAKRIHNDFYENFKYAKIWGKSAKFPNEKVGLDRELGDGTIIQLYA
jgi:ribosome-interacting GTPase 1